MRGQYSDVFVLLQIALIYPFDTCVNWWYKGFENRRVEQIGSCSYDGWVNGVEKWVCCNASGIKILLDLLERLIREDTKIYPKGSGKQDEKDGLAKKTVAEGKTFFTEIRLGLAKFTISC